MLTKNEIKFIGSLNDRNVRSESGLFLVEGEKMVSELLLSAFKIERLLVTAESKVEHPLAEIVSGKDMERISRLKTPSDVLAVVHIPLNGYSVVNQGLTLALDRIQDPGNMGTIIRIANWFGIKRIVASLDTVDCYNPKVVQATMGALFRVEVTYGDLTRMLGEYKAHGIPVCGTMLDGGVNIYKTPLKGDSVIVMGSEGKGLSEEVAAMLDRRLFIPPYPEAGNGCESLNVAVATAVVCAEFRRRASNE